MENNKNCPIFFSGRRNFWQVRSSLHYRQLCAKWRSIFSRRPVTCKKARLRVIYASTPPIYSEDSEALLLPVKPPKLPPRDRGVFPEADDLKVITQHASVTPDGGDKEASKAYVICAYRASARDRETLRSCGDAHFVNTSILLAPCPWAISDEAAGGSREACGIHRPETNSIALPLPRHFTLRFKTTSICSFTVSVLIQLDVGLFISYQ
jgi:hypothetical protein